MGRLTSEDVKNLHRRIYARAVGARDGRKLPACELAGRARFLERLKAESVRSLLELGAATGDDSVFFAEHGFDVLATDLSPEMVERCRDKGLEARVEDVTALGLGDASVDAVYAKNCLIHVPEHDIDKALSEIARVLVAGGIFHLSVYGGRRFEGVWEGDTWEHKRFFSFRTDEGLRQVVSKHFTIESFDCIEEGFGGYHYQLLIARKPTESV